MDAPAPLHDDLRRYLEFLRAHGAHIEVSPELAQHTDHHGDPHADERPERRFDFAGMRGLSETRVPGEALSADHATHAVARAMVEQRLIAPGSTFWDVGCGTGMLAVIAGRQGAGRVVGSDLDERALDLARRNAASNNVRLITYAGALLEPYPLNEVTDLAVANLPHKPRRRAGELVLAQDGGEDGVAVLTEFFRQFDARHPHGGRVLFFLHSLPHPRLLAQLSATRQVTLLAWKRRYFGRTEYGDLQTWFCERSQVGTSYVAENETGRFLIAGVWLASEPRASSASHSAAVSGS